MLIGEYNQNLDAKGRLNIPSKFRNDLGDSFVVSKGLNNTVYIYPKEEWRRFEQEIKSAIPSRRRMLQHFFCTGAEECGIDSQGRVVIPPKIREYAGLVKEVVVIGVSDKVEVWEKTKWDEYMNSSAFSEEEISSFVDELGM